jgi:two-component system, NarL family, nitrate/nitrite response regulator NarL
MSYNTVHPKQPLPVQQIPTILICKNRLVRAGLRHIFDGTPFMVAGEFEDNSKPPAFPEVLPALYILDESHSADALPKIVGDLKAQHPAARVVVFADHLKSTTILRALQAGMDGLCSTGMERAALIKALELVMLGEIFIPSTSALTLLNGVSQARESEPNVPPTLMPTNDTASGTPNLSSREAEILRWLMEGESNKVIAKKLHIAEATIKVHIKAILRKVRVKNRTQAAMWATAHLSSEPTSRHITQATK